MPQIREATYNDYAGLKKLWIRNGLHHDEGYNYESNDDAPGYKKWIDSFDTNPVIKKGDVEWPIGWVLVDNDNNIVGSFMNIPNEYSFKGKRYLGAGGSGWAIDEDYRNHSLLLLNKFAKQRNVDLLVTTTPANKTQRVFSAIFKNKYLSIDTLYNKYFLVLDYSVFTSNTYKKYFIQSIDNRIIKRMFNALPYSSYSLYDRICKRGFFSAQSDNQVHIVKQTEITDAFDDLWRALTDTYNDRFIAIRDAEYMRWYIKDKLTDGSASLHFIYKDTELIGYALFHYKIIKNINVAIFTDLQLLDEKPRYLTNLLRMMRSEFKGKNIQIVEIVGFHQQKRKIFNSISPYRRKISYPYIYYVFKNKELLNEINQTEVWDPTLLEGDATL